MWAYNISLLRHAGLQECNQSALFNRLESDWIYAHTQQPDAPWFMLLCDGPGILNDVIQRAVMLYEHAIFLKQTVVRSTKYWPETSLTACLYHMAVNHSAL